jgi:mono/diheme cytochrome c family protein
MGPRSRLAAALLPLAVLLVPPTTAAQDRIGTFVVSNTPEQIERGRAVFKEWCAACHSPGARQPGTQALDALYKGKKPGALEQRTDLVPKLTEAFVRKGVSVMAPFRKTEISDEDLAALAAYLAPRTR